MAFIFDHFVAILVGSVLVGGLLTVQMRQQQTSIESNQRDNVHHQADAFVTTLQRDIENTRTWAQSTTAFGGSTRYFLRRDATTDGEGYTEILSLPTLKDPALGIASPVTLVQYVAYPTGETVRMGSVLRPVLRIERHAYSRADGTSSATVAENVVDFEVLFVRRNSAEVTTGSFATSDPATLPVAAKVALVTALTGPLARSHDQQLVGVGTQSRLTRLVRILGAGAAGGLPPVETPAHTFPDLPDVPSDPPPPPPGTSPVPAPTPAPSPTPSSPAPSSPAPTPPRPTYPAPPAGAQI